MVILDGVDDLILRRAQVADAAGSTESCFYVLLQVMRNASPNLGVILTTTLPLAAVDPAILDRVDSLLGMPLPTLQQRMTYSAAKAADLFAPYVEKSDLLYVTALEVDNAQPVPSQAPSKGAPGASSSSSSSSSSRRREREEKAGDCSSSPETDVPETTDRQSSGSGVQELTDLLSRTSSGSGSSDLNLPLCLEVLGRASAGWSFRDLDKVLHAVVSAVLGTAQCRVTQRAFLSEVLNALQERGLQAKEKE